MADDKDILTIRKALGELRIVLRENHGDSRLTNKYLYSLIGKYAPVVIKQRSDAFRILKRQSFYQTINCVQVEEAPLIDPCCGVRSKCTVFRTRHKLPVLYEDSYGAIIKNVTTIDSSLELQPITPDSYLRKIQNPWGLKGANKDIYYFFNEGYLYFPTSNWKKYKVRGFFREDIADINLCDDCADTPSKECRRYMDKRLMLPPELWAPIMSLIEQEMASIYKQIPPDENINKNENLKQ